MGTPRTIKLVIAGDSGAGKTSFRNQYITGRFSSAYRATIGADFITKKLPHYANPDESVLLQIWDTAGQERFSALSTAFFRGADAVIFMFDVTRPDSLTSLRRWWGEFITKCPVPQDAEAEFCVLFVGNKIDLSSSHGSYVAEANGNGKRLQRTASGNVVTEQLAQRFMHELIPAHHPPSPIPESTTRRRTITMDGISLVSTATESEDNHATEPADIPHSNADSHADSTDTEIEPESPPRSVPRTRSVGMPSTSPRPPWASRSKSRGLSREGNGTVTTNHTVYHTPATSLFRTTSPARGGASRGASPNQSQVRRGGSSVMSMETARSNFSSAPTQPAHSRTVSRPFATTTASGSTIKPQKSPETTLPSLGVANGQHSDLTPDNIQLETGPRLFWTSARTGHGVPQVFEYVARRVVRRWEWEESRFGYDEGCDCDEGPTALRLRTDWGKGKKSWKAACC